MNEFTPEFSASDTIALNVIFFLRINVRLLELFMLKFMCIKSDGNNNKLCLLYEIYSLIKQQ